MWSSFLAELHFDDAQCVALGGRSTDILLGSQFRHGAESLFDGGRAYHAYLVAIGIHRLGNINVAVAKTLVSIALPHKLAVSIDLQRIAGTAESV